MLHAQDLTDMDMDELECTLANCISQRFIKGYISNKQKVPLRLVVGCFGLSDSARGLRLRAPAAREGGTRLTPALA